MKQARRLAVVYVPNGIIMKDWKPATAGQDFAFTRILKPLEPFRQDITLLSGLANRAAEKAKGGGHAKASGSFLSGAEVKYTAGPDVRAGVTFDQIVARALRLGDARSVSANRLRRCAHGGQLRHRIELRLYQQPLLEECGNAAPGGSESAIGIRAAVWRGRSRTFPPMSACAALCTVRVFSTTPARMRSA